MTTRSRLTVMIALLVEFIVSTFMGNTAQALLIGFVAGLITFLVLPIILHFIEERK